LEYVNAAADFTLNKFRLSEVRRMAQQARIYECAQDALLDPQVLQPLRYAIGHNFRALASIDHQHQHKINRSDIVLSLLRSRLLRDFLSQVSAEGAVNDLRNFARKEVEMNPESN